MSFFRTAQRVSPLEISDNFLFQRSLLAYQKASQIIGGKVLEIGTGNGYGISEIAPNTKEFWTLDKHYLEIDYQKFNNTRFIKVKVPPLKNIPSNYFDFVICFQVIEHIENDKVLLEEIKRVLKINGKLLISTPNVKMSLTRNPWHIREYTYSELKSLLNSEFKVIQMLGIYGDQSILAYYGKNKQSVNKIQRYDILKLNEKLPRWMLKIPYDLLNRINRRKLYKKNKYLCTGLSTVNYFYRPVSDECFDLFFIAQKQH